MNPDFTQPRSPESTCHDLRTPMVALVGYAELLLEEAESAREGAALNILNRILAQSSEVLSAITELGQLLRDSKECTDQSFTKLKLLRDEIMRSITALGNESAFVALFRSDVDELSAAGMKLSGIIEHFGLAKKG